MMQDKNRFTSNVPVQGLVHFRICIVSFLRRKSSGGRPGFLRETSGEAGGRGAEEVGTA